MFRIDEDNCILWTDSVDPEPSAGINQDGRLTVAELKRVLAVRAAKRQFAAKRLPPSQSQQSFSFATELGLMALADSRGLTREDLEGIWNGFAGTPKFSELKPVVKFRNRPYGVKQIWKAIQRLDPSYIDADFVEEKEPDWGFPREGSKAARAIQLMKRANGISGVDLQEAMGWLPHTTRGFISTIQSKHKIAVITTKHESKGMVYRIEA